MNFGIVRRAAASGGAIVDRVLCVAGAVLFSQAPEFMQQYLQRLGGHLDEARLLIGRYEDIARQAGVTLEGFIARTGINADSVVAKHAGVMRDAVARAQDLAAAQAAIQDTSMFTRPFAFLRHVDHEIAANTLAIFKPAVPTTAEGLLYAAAGMAVMLGFYHGCIRFPVTRCWRKYREYRGRKMEKQAF